MSGKKEMGEKLHVNIIYDYEVKDFVNCVILFKSKLGNYPNNYVMHFKRKRNMNVHLFIVF